DRYRGCGHETARDLAGGDGRVLLQVPARDGARHQRPRGALVREEVAPLVRLVARRVVHVLPAAAAEQRHRGQGEVPSHGSTSVTAATPGRPSRKRRVSVASNRGSVDSRQRKKRSRVASANDGTLNTGW